MGSASLENDCDTLSTTDTSASDGVSFVESVKVVHQVGSDSCSTRCERMPESCGPSLGVSREQKGPREKERRTDSSTENVRLVVREVEFSLNRQPLSSESFVDIEEL